MNKNKHIPIHFVVKRKTACGLSVTRQIAMTYNPRLVTCLRCRKTHHYIHAFGCILRQKKDEKIFVQMPLFSTGGLK
jgi:hypothetical protein